MLKLIHIADLHLDAPFRWLGERGDDQRRQLRQAFRAAIDLTIGERADALLIAGDLFDSNSPAEETIELVRTQLRRLDAPTFILPGTHDCLDDYSVYRRTGLVGGKARVFDADHSSYAIPELDLTVHGQANRTKTSATSPLAGLRRNPATRHNVALAHGSVAGAGTSFDYPIRPSDLEESVMDYVALGHYHVTRDCSTAHTTAWYSGPLDVLASDQEPGRALVVHLDDRGVRIEQRCLNRRRLVRETIQLDLLRSAEDIAERLRPLRDPDLILSVALRGARPLDLVLDVPALAAELADSFFRVTISDESQAALSDAELASLPEKLVSGQFACRMRQRIAAATTPEERRIAESALQIGIALLQGRRVVGDL